MKELFLIFYRRIISVVIMASLIVPLFFPWKQLDVFSATAESEFGLAVILVEESMYTGSLLSKINRYAEDVQKSYDETKSLIIPVSSSKTSDEIYRILQNLYLEGQVKGNQNFFLKGVILIGEIPLPLLTSSYGSTPSVYPYTDFIEPVFLWDMETDQWIENPSHSFTSSEIWHGVIPGTRMQLEQFFDKNHETHSQLHAGNLPTKDEILFWDSENERLSAQSLLTGQYELGQKIMQERKSFRYNKELLKSLYSQYLNEETFSTEDLDLNASLFPSGEKVFLQSIGSITDIFRETFWRDSPDRFLKDSIEELLPNYAESVKRYETDVQKLVQNTGRWDKATTDSVPEMISVIDEWVGNEIKRMNIAAHDGAFTALEKMDAGALVVDQALILQLTEQYEPGSEGGTELVSTLAPINNFYYGKATSSIDQPQQCTIYRGSYLYEDQYENISYSDWLSDKKNNRFSDNQALLFHEDPLPSTPSQEVEFNSFYDSSALLDHGDPIEYTKQLGGCSVINSEAPDKCDVHSAITPVFSWTGGHKIILETEVLLDKDGIKDFPVSETTGLTCERFNFNEDETSIGWQNGNPVTKQDAVMGNISYREIPSIISQAHPLLEGEESLQNVIAQPLAKSLPVNRASYIDFQTGDPSLRQYVRNDIPDFSRYQYKKESENALRTQYELSQLALVNDKKLVGGNSVFNREIQPKDTQGIAVQSASFRFQRVLQFVDGEMKTSQAFPVPDDDGKIPLDYENEIASGILSRIGAGNGDDVKVQLRDQMALYAAEYRGEKMNIDPGFLYDHVRPEANRFVADSWEFKAIELVLNNSSVVSTIQEKLSQHNASTYGLPARPQQYYLHDIASENASLIDESLNEYLVPRSAISDETFKGVRWQMTPISQEFAPDWKSEIDIENLPETEGELFLEVFEVIAAENDVYDSFIEVGGRSFLGLRKNAESETDFYAEATGVSSRDHSIERLEIITSDPGVAGDDFGIAGFTVPELSAPSLCPMRTKSEPEEPEMKPISESLFYGQNTISRNECERTVFIDLHSPGSSLPDSKSMTQKIITEDIDVSRLDMVFRWKDMSAAEKHDEIQKILLDKNDNRIPLDSVLGASEGGENSETSKTGYAYAHWKIEGDNSPIWKGEDGVVLFQGIDFENDPQAQIEYSDTQSLAEQNTTCGPIDGVPLLQWIPAIQCWLTELQTTGIEFVHKCSLDLEAFKSEWEKDYERDISYIKILPTINPLLGNHNNSVSIEFFTDSDKHAMGKRVAFTVELEGAKASSSVPDQDSELDGLQLSDADGGENIEIIPESDTVTISVSAEYKGKTIEKTETFSVINNQSFTVLEKSVTEENGVKAYVLSVSANQAFDTFTDELYLSISPQTEAVLSTNTITLGEEFSVAVRTDSSVEVSASYAGVDRATHVLQGSDITETGVADIAVPDLPPYIDFNETLILPIIFLNDLGTEIYPSIMPVAVSNNTDNAEVSIIEKSNRYFAKIKTFQHSGTTSFTLSSGSLTRDFSFLQGAKTSKDEYASYDFNALYATITGLEDYGISLKDHFATQALHSSSVLNAVTTHITSPERDTPVARVFESGNVLSFSSGYSPVLLSLSPLQMGIFDEYETRYKGKFVFTADSVSSVVLNAPYEEKEGLFFENMSSLDSFTAEKTSNSLRVLFEEILVAEIETSGKITLHDNRFEFQINENGKDGFSLFLEKNDDSYPLAEITFRGGKWIENGESSWVEKNKEDEGFSLIEKNGDTYELFKNLQTEFSGQSFGMGFESRSKYVLEFASGNTVGESTVSSSDIFLINIGDPSIFLPQPQKNSMGFDGTIGTEIFTEPEGDIIEVLSLDFDGDGMGDLAKIDRFGNIEFFTSEGTGGFHRWGKGVKIDANYRMIGTLDIDGDGFDDVIYADKKGDWHHITNQNGKFLVIDAPSYFPSQPLISGEIEDVDRDGNSDVVGITANGSVNIWYGTGNKVDIANLSAENNNETENENIPEVFEEPKEIDMFSFEVPSNDDLKSSLLISFPGIETLEEISDQLQPLAYFSVQPTSQQYALSADQPQETLDDLAAGIAGLGLETSSTENSAASAQNAAGVSGNLFAPLSLFPNSITAVKSMEIDESIAQENSRVGSRALVKIEITSNDANAFSFTLSDIYSSLLSLEKTSLQCENCGDQYAGPSFSSVSQNIIFEDLIIEPGEKIIISYTARINVLPKMEMSLGNINEDEIVDIIISRKNKGSKHYMSIGVRDYEEDSSEEESAESIPEFLQDLADNDGNGVPDKFETDSDGNGMGDFVQEVIEYSDSDDDNDGVPNVWDDGLNGNENLAALEEGLDQIIDFLASCNGGGCVSMPLNYAFFVPGQPNVAAPILANMTQTGFSGLDSALQDGVNGVNSEISAVIDKLGIPSGFQPYVMTVYNQGPSGSVCIWNSCWQPCWPGGMCPLSYDRGFAMSTFRLYISPTLTGGVGVVACTGPGGDRRNPASLRGKCFIQAVPTELLGDFCEKLSGIISQSNNVSIGVGKQMFQVESGLASGNDEDLLSYSLAEIDSSIPTSQNIRTNGQDFFGRWANRQAEELNAMLTLPALTIYYPDISSSFYNNDGKDFSITSGFLNSQEYDDAKQDFTTHISNQEFEKNYLAEEEKNRKAEENRANGIKGNDATSSGDSNESSFVHNAKEKVNNGYDGYTSLEPAQKFLQKAEYKAESIDDFYRMMESVPLLNMQRIPVTIKYPSLSRREIITKINDIDDWIENAENEVSQLEKSREGWDNTEKEQMDSGLEEAKKTIEDIKKLKGALEFYRDDAPRLMADLDSEVAKYVYSIICYLDAMSELTGKWLLRNKIRYEKWLELFATLPKILEAFQTFPKVFRSYQGYCETCRATNYDSGSFIVNILGNFVPEPPVIKFPRLPDIVLDISKINAAITVNIPEIIIKPVAIKIPTFPQLSLPQVPTQNFTFSFPDIPELPTFEIPKLPPFPDIAIPKLPDIPPPPKIPSFMADFGDVMKIIEKGLFLYCLIVRKGIFVYPEATSMSVVETLTARPLNPLNIDFLSLNYPDINLPSISEIEVSVEVNLEKDLDYIVEPVQEFADSINEQTTNFMKDTKFSYPDFMETLNQSGALDGIGEKAQEKVDSIVDPINEKSDSIDEDLEESADTLQDSIDNKTEEVEEDISLQLWKNMMNKERITLENKWENVSKNSNGYLDISQFRKELGLPVFRTEKRNPVSQKRYSAMKQELLSLQNFYETRQEAIIIAQDVSPMFDSFENDEWNIPSRKVYALEGNEDAGLNTNDITASNLMSTVSASIPNSVNSQQGVFMRADDGTVLRLTDYIDEVSTINSFFFMDVNQDGKEDIIYSTPFEIFVKIQSDSHVRSLYNGGIEIESFDTLLPAFHAPQNLEVYGDGKNLSLSVLPEQKEQIAGLLYIIDDALTHQSRNNGEDRKYIFQLKKEVFDELDFEYETETEIPFADLSQPSIQIRSNPIPIDENSTIRIDKFDYGQLEIYLEYNRINAVRAYWILEDGTLGNVSSHDLVMNTQATDDSSPLVLDKSIQQGYLYKENDITLGTFYDLENGTNSIAWDTDRDGSFELQSEIYTSPEYRLPTTEYIPFQVTDIANNSASDTATIIYSVPDILLSQADTTTVSGNILPRYENAPATLLRERFGITKKIKETVATDSQGNYLFNDFNLSPNAEIKDLNDNLIAEVGVDTATLNPVNTDYSSLLLPGDEKNPMRQVLINNAGNIVANVIVKTKDDFAVQEKETFSGVWAEGTYVQDLIQNDSFQFGSLPIDAPSNAGGSVLFNKENQKPIAMIYKSGNIQFFDSEYASSNFSLQQKSITEDNHFIIEILFENEVIAEVLLYLSDDHLLINTSENITGTVSLDILSSAVKESLKTVLDISKLLAADNSSLPASAFNKAFPFSDVSDSHSAYNAIERLYQKNMIAGYSDNLFRPNQTITRAEFIHLSLAVTDCLDCITPSLPEKKKWYSPYSFPDVLPKDWYDFCVSKAKKLSMIQGYGDGLFRPNQNISRAEAVAVLLRQSNIPMQITLTESIGDLNPEAWYYESMVTGLNTGLISSTIGFSFPNEKITRGEFALMADKLSDLRDCRSIDSDNDGFSDYIEEYFGTNLLDSNEVPSESESTINPRDQVLSPVPLESNSEENNSENKPLETTDSDGDGIPDKFDSDINGDGNNFDENNNTQNNNGNGDNGNNNNIGNSSDDSKDSDNDGISDRFDSDKDGDGNTDTGSEDQNNDGILDMHQTVLGLGDGKNVFDFIDTNNNGINDRIENAKSTSSPAPSLDPSSSNIPSPSPDTSISPISSPLTSPSPTEQPETIDLCPFVPEDLDGIDDDDGCPEIQSHEREDENQDESEITIIKGDPEICGYINYVADLRTGDIVWSAILSDDEKELYKKSGKMVIE